jgi:hypothetical protein
MAHVSLASGAPAPLASPGTVPADYQAGVCNIGPAEIARRRRAGNVGLIATLALFAILVAVDAPPIARLVIALPATIAASGYLQAYLKFCAGFGSRGIFNFDDVGTTEQVADAAARALDKARATKIGLASFAIGIAAGIVAAILPI